jgi:hypothetical protein
MKDLPHHMKKLNRQVIRSMHREELEEEEFDLSSIPPQKQTEREIKKQHKQKVKNERLAHVPSALTPDEKNRKMKKRVPIFDRNNAKPRIAKPTKKKTPRI